MDKDGLIEHLNYCMGDTDITIRIGNKIYPIDSVLNNSSNDRLILIPAVKGKPRD